MTPAEDFNIESAAKYGNLCRVAIGFAVTCDSDIETFYAYLNARWAARLALAELGERDLLVAAETNAALWRRVWTRAVEAHDSRMTIRAAAEELEFWTNKRAMLYALTQKDAQ